MAQASGDAIADVVGRLNYTTAIAFCVSALAVVWALTAFIHPDPDARALGRHVGVIAVTIIVAVSRYVWRSGLK